jgi:hypothetical protein
MGSDPHAVRHRTVAAARDMGRDFTPDEIVAIVGGQWRTRVIGAIHAMVETGEVERVNVGCGRWVYRVAPEPPAEVPLPNEGRQNRARLTGPPAILRRMRRDGA